VMEADGFYGTSVGLSGQDGLPNCAFTV
jgi:hypothetical protein